MQQSFLEHCFYSQAHLGLNYSSIIYDLLILGKLLNSLSFNAFFSKMEITTS